ncbi:MAG: hypothetical protein ACRC8S_05115 [Fimbriiglobus sp.]
MARRQGKPEPLDWVGLKLASLGTYTVEAFRGVYTYSFASLPELANDWFQFTLCLEVPYDPTPEVVDRILDCWEWYRSRHLTDSAIFRDEVVSLYRACGEYGPEDLSDAEILAQVERAYVTVCAPDLSGRELYATVYPEFETEHAPAFYWDAKRLGWRLVV